LYTTSYVLTCISYVLAYNIAYDIAYDIVYDIVCNVHSIGFGAGFRGFKLHARSRRHSDRSLHGKVFIQVSTAPPVAGGPAPSQLVSAAAAGAAAAAAAGAADSSSSSSPDMVKLQALGVNGFACWNVHNIPFSTVNILGRHHAFVHVLQLRQVVQEYIVQKGVVLDSMVKRWIFSFHGVGKTLLVVKKGHLPKQQRVRHGE
jgi:hypothetical protein